MPDTRISAIREPHEKAHACDEQAGALGERWAQFVDGVGPDVLRIAGRPAMRLGKLLRCQMAGSAVAAGGGDHVAAGHPESAGVLVTVLQDSQEAGAQRPGPAERLKDRKAGDRKRVVLGFLVEELPR